MVFLANTLHRNNYSVFLEVSSGNPIDYSRLNSCIEYKNSLFVLKYMKRDVNDVISGRHPYNLEVNEDSDSIKANKIGKIELNNLDMDDLSKFDLTLQYLPAGFYALKSNKTSKLNINGNTVEILSKNDKMIYYKDDKGNNCILGLNNKPAQIKMRKEYFNCYTIPTTMDSINLAPINIKFTKVFKGVCEPKLEFLENTVDLSSFIEKVENPENETNYFVQKMLQQIDFHEKTKKKPSKFIVTFLFDLTGEYDTAHNNRQKCNILRILNEIKDYDITKHIPGILTREVLLDELYALYNLLTMIQYEDGIKKNKKEAENLLDEISLAIIRIQKSGRVYIGKKKVSVKKNDQYIGRYRPPMYTEYYNDDTRSVHHICVVNILIAIITYSIIIASCTFIYTRRRKRQIRHKTSEDEYLEMVQSQH
ncbi:hypothetical protein ECANGB1_2359 [Enterospora canceri]|uniref:Uncharacterized protein n=1 Tax=Enterospora canceri TaxID=1081671 RepID=A0A1Y1S8Q0_9MICR|nr:hypothetical protein ECANGB1_2359 [Enterospora canceri]